MDKRFESYDWLKAIGGFLFLAAALLPWWERGTAGIEVHRDGLDDWLGILATVIFVGIALLTVIVETESLPIPRRLMDPTWVLGAAIVGSLCVLTRLVFNPFGGGDNVRDARDLGLYLALVAATVTMVGCVLAYKDRDAWLASLGDDDDDDEVVLGGDPFADYDRDEQDDLIRRINTSLDRDASPPPAPRRTRSETEHERRRAQREQRAADRSTARRRDDREPPVT